MAKGAELVAGGCPAHTIYIWPSRELIARSWDWPEAWHEAFEQAVHQLAGLAATCVLGGLPVTQEPAARQLRAGRVSFRIKCSGTRIYIAVLDFEGPHAPGPNGGTRRQAYPVDAFVLGLRGSGKSFTIVTFYGPRPPVPAENFSRGPWRSVMPVNVQDNEVYNPHSNRYPMVSIMWMPIECRMMLPNGIRKILSCKRRLGLSFNLACREEAHKHGMSFSPKEHRSIWQDRLGRNVRRKQESFRGLELASMVPLSLTLRRSSVNCRFDGRRPLSESAAGMQLP